MAFDWTRLLSDPVFFRNVVMDHRLVLMIASFVGGQVGVGKTIFRLQRTVFFVGSATAALPP